MKKLIALITVIAVLMGITSFAAYELMEIGGSYGFVVLDNCYDEAEEDFLFYYHSGCSQSMKIMPAVKKYAEDNDLLLYIVDYRKSKCPGVGEYFDTSMITFPVILAYNNGINALGGINGIKSEKDFKNFANEFLGEKNPEIKITIDSKEMYCDGRKVELDVPATIVNGRTMLPLRAIMEAYGLEVSWDEATGDITAKRYSTEITIQPSRGMIFIGRKYRWLDTTPVIVEGRTLVPVRTLAETLGAEVIWDEATRTVTLK